MIEVKEHVSLVNYKLSIAHRRSKKMTLHVNRMKLWNNADTRVMRVVVAEEDSNQVI